MLYLHEAFFFLQNLSNSQVGGANFTLNYKHHKSTFAYFPKNFLLLLRQTRVIPPSRRRNPEHLHLGI